MIKNNSIGNNLTYKFNSVNSESGETQFPSKIILIKHSLF